MGTNPDWPLEGELDEKGLFDEQLSLPLQSSAAPSGYPAIRRRDGSEAPFDREQIAETIYDAARTVGGEDRDLAASLARAVEIYLAKRFESGGVATVDHVHDAVERVLIQMSHARTALAYARLRDRRDRLRRLRQGDLQVLLSELDEARFEREGRESRGEPLLFARRGGEREVSWDRDWLTRSLVREAALTTEQAESVSSTVERRLAQTGVRRITVGLVREMARAELLERGWDEACDRSRQLALSLYDTENLLRGRTPETVSQHPGATDGILARSVKREYALAQVLPAEATEAHLSGELHIARLATIDRFAGASHSLAYVAQRGVWGPGNRQIAAPASHGDTLLAHMVKWDDLMRQYVSDSVRWTAINVYFAPYLYGLEQHELQQFAQMLLYEYAYRALANPLQEAPTRIEICWSIPSSMKTACAVGPGGETIEETYGEFEHTAQQFAWALVEELRAAAAAGSPLPAPESEILFEGPCLRAPGQERFIAHVATAIAAGAPVVLRFDRTSQGATLESWNSREIIMPPVALNLARAAWRSKGGDPFEVVIERMLSSAVHAQRERRGFLEALAVSQDSPLGLVAWSETDAPYMSIASAHAPIAVDGLWECLCILYGLPGKPASEWVEHGDAVLRHLRERCNYFSRREGFSIPLLENDRAAISRRLASMDGKEIPASSEVLPWAFPLDSSPMYSTGVSLPAHAPLNPWERSEIEARWKTHVDRPAAVRVRLPRDYLAPESVSSFITRLYRDSACEAASFDISSN